jgi:hypothetical protein
MYDIDASSQLTAALWMRGLISRRRIVIYLALDIAMLCGTVL